jgi:hypothetical protein
MGAAMMLSVIAAGRAHADPFTVAGTTTGAFNGGQSADVTSVGPLTFDGNDAGFSLFTDGWSDRGVFGSFSLGFDPFSFSGQTFALSVAFLAPQSAQPNPTLLSTTLTGAVLTDTLRGLVGIHWDSPANVTFDGGHFSVWLDDMMWLKSGETQTLTGFIVGTTATVSEPTLLLLFGTGLFLLAATRRRVAPAAL